MVAGQLRALAQHVAFVDAAARFPFLKEIASYDFNVWWEKSWAGRWATGTATYQD